MKFTAAQIAGLVGGTVEGNPEATITKLSKIEEGEAGSLSFLSNPLYTPHIYRTGASVVIVNNTFVAENRIGATLIRVDNADIAFAKLLEVYNQIKNDKKGISKLSAIAESAKLGTDVYVGEFAVIGEQVVIGDNVKIHPHVYVGDNSIIGDNTILFSGVKIYSDNKIGRRCMLHAGTVIGLVVETHCNFFDSLAYPQKIDAGLRVGRQGRSSVRYEIGLFAEGVELCAALGHLIHVYVDRDQRRPVPVLPDTYLLALKGLTP
jgi:acetyltransferase-like isoleucine patch superfamily enzyme